MRLPAVNPFVSFTKRTEISLDFLDKPERGALLSFPGMLAHRTVHTDFGQQAVSFRNLAFCRFSVTLFFAIAASHGLLYLLFHHGYGPQSKRGKLFRGKLREYDTPCTIVQLTHSATLSEWEFQQQTDL